VERAIGVGQQEVAKAKKLKEITDSGCRFGI
jgi:hypothetical protein